MADKSEYLGTHWITDRLLERSLHNERFPSSGDLEILAPSTLMYGWRFRNGISLTAHQCMKINSREEALAVGVPVEVCDEIEKVQFVLPNPEAGRRFTWDRLHDYLLCNPFCGRFREDI